jgi:putative transcriptional regulator
MSKSGKKMLVGARQALEFARGKRRGFLVHAPSKVDVRAIRSSLGLSQREFSSQFGLDLAAVRNWEQKRRKPHGTARLLLRVIEREPEAVLRALAG